MALAETDKGLVKSIKAGDIPAASQLARSFFDKNPSQYDAAHSWLSRLQSVCFQNKIEISSTSSALHVFQLTELLCEVIASSRWQGDRLRFMQSLYHVVVYMMKYDISRARQLSLYFFSLKEGKDRPQWTSNELIVLANLTYEFSAKIIERLPTILEVPEGKDSLPDWIDFLFELTELHEFVKLHKTVVIMNQFLLRVHSTAAGKLTEVVDVFLVKLNKWSSRIVASNKAVQNFDQCFDGLINLFHNVIFLVPKKELISRVRPISSCLDAVKMWLPQYQVTLEMLDSVLNLAESLKTHRDSIEVNADRLFACVRSKGLSMKVFPSVLGLLGDFSADIISSGLVNSRLADLAQLMNLLVFANYNSDSGSKKIKLFDAISCGLLILTCESVSKEGLQSVFQDVRALIKKFEKIVGEANCVSTSFILSVRATLAALQAYKTAELYDETERICHYILYIFIKIDPQKLYENYYLRRYVEQWIRCWAFLSQKKMMGVDAQVLLLVFALFHPKFIIPTMKAWAGLKRSKSPSIATDATVLDIISVNVEEIKQKFPTVELDVNKEVFLLAEVLAYTKTRDLHGGPVLGVFKAAAKVVKHHVALANILCCTIDAYSFDVSDKMHCSSLRTSLLNLITHLEKLEKTKDKELTCHRSVLLCTLGNLNYHKSRLEAQQLRQKAEEIQKERESWSLKEQIPLLRRGNLYGKDNLDVTEVTLVSSNEALKWSCGDKLIPTLKEAIRYWSACEPSLEPDFFLCGTLSFVKGAGYILRLYGYRELEISCWQLLYKIATKLKSDKYKFLAAGELLGVCRVVDSSILSEVEDLMKDSKRIDVKCYAPHLYRVNLAKNLFLRGEFEGSRAALQEVDEVGMAPHFLVKAQHRILVAIFQIAQPEGGPTPAAPMSSIVKIFSNILFCVTNDKWETFNEASVIQWLLIETSTLLATLYADMKNIRKARAYMHSEMKLIHKLGLPAKVCEVMALRCWVDLLTCNVADTDRNADEIESLLQLGVVKKESVNGSPLAGGTSIKCVPHFLKHKDCQCPFCSVANYPTLVLSAIIVRTLILLGSDAHREAQIVISIGISVVEVVKEKDLACSSLVQPFSASVARFYYTVASAYMQWGRYEEADRYASLASDIAHGSPIHNRHLIGSIKRLSLSIQWVTNYQPLAKQEPDISSLYAEEVSPEKAVTPEAQKYGRTKPWISTLHKNKKIDTELIEDHRYVPLVKRRISGMKDFEAAVANIGDIDSSPPGNAKPKGKAFQENYRISEVSRKFFKTPKNKADSNLGNVLKSMKKLNLKQIDEVIDDDLGTAPLPSTPGFLLTPATPPTRKVKTEVKPKNPRVNAVATPSIACLAKMGQSTPTVKVFFDPEGVASTTKKAKTAKKAPRLGALSKATQERGFGTPATTSSRSQTARGKFTWDDSSDDDIVMVTAPKKKPGMKGKGEKVMADGEGVTAISDARVDSVASLLGSQLKVKDEPDLKIESESAGPMAAPMKRAVRTRLHVSPKQRGGGDQSMKTVETATKNLCREKPEEKPQSPGSNDFLGQETDASNGKSLPKSNVCGFELLKTPIKRAVRAKVFVSPELTPGEHSVKTGEKPTDNAYEEKSEERSQSTGSSVSASSIYNSVDSDESIVIQSHRKLLNRLQVFCKKPMIIDETRIEVSAIVGEGDVDVAQEVEASKGKSLLRRKGCEVEPMKAPVKRAVRTRAPTLQKQAAGDEQSMKTPQTPSKNGRESPQSAGSNGFFATQEAEAFNGKSLPRSEGRGVEPIKTPSKRAARARVPTSQKLAAGEQSMKSARTPNKNSRLRPQSAGSNGLSMSQENVASNGKSRPKSEKRAVETMAATTKVPARTEREIWAESIAAPHKRAVRMRLPITEKEEDGEKRALAENCTRREPLKTSSSAGSVDLCPMKDASSSILSQSDASSAYYTAGEPDVSLVTAPRRKVVGRDSKTRAKIIVEDDSSCETSLREIPAPSVNQPIRRCLNKKTDKISEQMLYVTRRRPQHLKSKNTDMEKDKPEDSGKASPPKKSQVPFADRENPDRNELTASRGASESIPAPSNELVGCPEATGSVHDDSVESSDQDSFDIVDSSINPDLTSRPTRKKALKLT